MVCKTHRRNDRQSCTQNHYRIPSLRIFLRDQRNMYTINSFVFGAVNYTVYRPKYLFQLRIRSDAVCTIHRLNLKLERLGLVYLRKDFVGLF